MTGIVNEFNLFSGIYSNLSTKIPNKRLLLFIYSAIGGILPIPGRCIMSASLIDTITTKDTTKRQKFGIVDYLSTHHYYFWSPLEKTVIIPMAVLGLTYMQFMSYIWPLLTVYSIYTITVILTLVKEDDIVFKFEPISKSPWHIAPLLSGILLLILGIAPWIVFSIIPIYYIIATKSYNIKKLMSYVNGKLVALLSGVLILSHFGKIYANPLVKDLELTVITFPLCAILFLCAFLMGSSSKFAGIVALLCSTFGVVFLPLFFAIEFAAYLISPTHKCVVISKEYFGTSLSKFYGVVGGLAVLIMAVGYAVTYF